MLMSKTLLQLMTDADKCKSRKKSKKILKKVSKLASEISTDIEGLHPLDNDKSTL